MTTPNTPFTAIYTKWLESFRALIPGCVPAGPAAERTPKQQQVEANQEWEDEGGSIKPPAEQKPGVEPGPKLPL